jgi:hypothetical protein
VDKKAFIYFAKKEEEEKENNLRVGPGLFSCLWFESFRLSRS